MALRAALREGDRERRRGRESEREGEIPVAEPSRRADPMRSPGTATSVPRPEEERTLNHVTRYLQVVHAPGRALPPAGAVQARRKEKEARKRRHE